MCYSKILLMHSTAKQTAPFPTRSSDTNNTWCGMIYVNTRYRRPPQVETEYVVKNGSTQFNKVDSDQNQEWLIGLEKRRVALLALQTHFQLSVDYHNYDIFPKWPQIFKMAAKHSFNVHNFRSKHDRIMFLVSKCTFNRSRNSMR